MGRDRCSHSGLRAGNRTIAVTQTSCAPLAVVPGGALQRLDLERDAVDGDDPHLLTGD